MKFFQTFVPYLAWLQVVIQLLDWTGGLEIYGKNYSQFVLKIMVLYYSTTWCRTSCCTVQCCTTVQHDALHHVVLFKSTWCSTTWCTTVCSTTWCTTWCSTTVQHDAEHHVVLLYCLRQHDADNIMLSASCCTALHHVVLYCMLYCYTDTEYTR